MRTIESIAPKEEMDKARDSFVEIVGTSFVFLKHNTNATDGEIIIALQETFFETLSELISQDVEDEE